MSFLVVLSAGIALAWIGQLCGCLLVRGEGWDRALGLLIAMIAMLFLVAMARPGDISPGEDLGNGLLIWLLIVQTVGLWSVAAVGALLFHSSARRIANRIRGSNDADTAE